MHIAGRVYDTGHGGSREILNGNEGGSRSMLGSQRPHCHERESTGVVDSSNGMGLKEQTPRTTNRYRAELLDGHRDRQTRR